MPWWDAKDGSRVPPMLGKRMENPVRWTEQRKIEQSAKKKKWWAGLTSAQRSAIASKQSVKLKGLRTPLKVRKHLARVIKQKYTDPVFRANMLVVARDKKRRAKLVAVSKRLWADPLYRAKQKEAMSHRKPMSAASRKKISKAIKGKKYPPRSAQHRLNLSKALRKPTTLARLRASAVKTRTSYDSPNKAELQLDAILTANFPGLFKLNVNGRSVAGKIPDFIAKQKKLIVELFGDYWHGEGVTGRTTIAEEAYRRAHFKGYDVLIVWEHELVDEKRLINKIAKWIKHYQ
jgi:very-short-patch-repair endonuclease